MSYEQEFIRNEIKEIVVYIFLGVVTSILLPIALGMIFLGFEESFVEGSPIEFGSLLGSFIIYYIWIIGSLALIIYPIGALTTIKRGEHPATQPNPTIFRMFTVSMLFSPENGALYKLFEGLGFQKNPMRFTKSILRMIALSILVFGALGIAQVAIPGLQVVGVPQIQTQQVTIASDVLFTSFVPAWAETMTILFVLFFLMGVIAYLTSKFLRDRGIQLAIFYLVGLTIAGLIIAFIWGAGIHRIVYGSSEVKTIASIIFGFVGSALTILTFTFIPFWIWHITNNVFARLSELVTINEDVIFIAIIIWIIFFFFYISAEVITYRIKRKLRDKKVVPSI